MIFEISRDPKPSVLKKLDFASDEAKVFGSRNMNSRTFTCLTCICACIATSAVTALIFYLSYPRVSSKNTVLITDPEVKALVRFNLIYGTSFSDHSDYSIDRALNETRSVTLDLDCPVRVLQLRPEVYISTRGSRYSQRSVIPECLYLGYQDRGYCFTNLNITGTVLHYTIAWWKEKFTLYVLTT